MAEKIVSPGVFTTEIDQSFLPAAIGEIGAAIVGPTAKGPAMVPTVVSSFSEFEEMIGGVDNRFYTPYTVEQYLKSAGVVTIVRILGLGGYQVDTVRLLAHSSGGTKHSLAVSAETYTLSFNTSSANFITEVLSSDPQSAKSGNSDSSVYVYRIFKDSTHIIGDSELHTGGSHNVYATASIANDSNGLDFKTGATSIDSLGNESSYTGNQTYNTARSPYIQSQLSNNARYNLFRLYSRSHGDDINSRMKVAILNIKRA